MTLVMGILNITPDSFSDGGRFLDPMEPAEAERRRAAGFPWTQPGEPIHSLNSDLVFDAATQLQAEGADLIDIGGESTRPGAEPVHFQEEIRRVTPAFQELFLRREFPVSLDTRHAETAYSALVTAADRASELIINDISGLVTEPEMPQVIAKYGCQVVITHNRGDAKTMQNQTTYDDVTSSQREDRLVNHGLRAEQLHAHPPVVAQVIEELLTVRQWYLDAGVAPERIILDPGLGFAKTHAQNWALIRGLSLFTQLGHRVLFGASRKGFLGALLGTPEGTPRPADQRDTATAVLTAHAAAAGCWAVRVHNVLTSADALVTAAALHQREH